MEKKFIRAEAIILFIASFFLSVIYQLNHEFWSDEAFTLFIVQNSSSFSDLINRLTFTGHPVGYYLIEYFIYKIGGIVALQMANAFCVASVVFLFSLRNDLNFFTKVLFCISFFPLYQYGGFLRSYSLLAFLIYSSVFLLVKYRDRMYWLLPALVLPHVHLFGAGVAISICIAQLLMTYPVINRSKSIASGLLLVSIVLSLYTILYNYGGVDNLRIGGVSEGLITTLSAFIPRQVLFFDDGKFLWPISILLLISIYRIISKSLPAVLLFISSHAISLFFFAHVYLGYPWHAGILFFCFLSALLFVQLDLFASIVLVIILLVQCSVSIPLFFHEIAYSYSSSKNVYKYLVETNKVELDMIAVSAKIDSAGECKYRFAFDPVKPIVVYAQEDNKKINIHNHKADDKFTADYFDKDKQERPCSGILMDIRKQYPELGTHFVLIAHLKQNLEAIQLLIDPSIHRKDFNDFLEYGERYIVFDVE